VEQKPEVTGHGPAGVDGDFQFDDEGVEVKWRYFIVAMLVVGYAMLAVGAPLVAVVAGIALAALMNLKQLGTWKTWHSKKSPFPATLIAQTPATRTVNR
jgi:hypothetical protein